MERDLLDKVQRKIGATSARVHIGIGDDAAVVTAPPHSLVLCNDSLCEDADFTTQWATPADLGHKALAIVLSDIAAMGAQPCYALVNLCIPAAEALHFVEGFYDSMAALARHWNVDIVGGDLGQSPDRIFIDVTLAGDVQHALKRSGARPQDLLIVSGTLGAAAAGLQVLQNGTSEKWPSLRQAQLRPTPRLDLVPFLQTPGLVTSLIDISDGFARDLHRLSRMSNVGFDVQTEKLPVHPDVQAYNPTKALELALYGGEDYQLLFTVDPHIWQQQAAQRPTDLSVVGTCRPFAQGVSVHDQGFDHFLAT